MLRRRYKGADNGFECMWSSEAGITCGELPVVTVGLSSLPKKLRALVPMETYAEISVICVSVERF